MPFPSDPQGLECVAVRDAEQGPILVSRGGKPIGIGWAVDHPAERSDFREVKGIDRAPAGEQFENKSLLGIRGCLRRSEGKGIQARKAMP